LGDGHKRRDYRLQACSINLDDLILVATVKMDRGTDLALLKKSAISVSKSIRSCALREVIIGLNVKADDLRDNSVLVDLFSDTRLIFVAHE
jgi:hypothetical protein